MAHGPPNAAGPPGGPDVSTLRIEYSAEAIEAVRTAAVEGLYKLARGGLDVGGLLLGRKDGDILHILGSRPIACEHARGPSFLLSPNDEAALDAQLASLASEAEASGLALAGWYRSNTRGGLLLTGEDRALWDRYCPQPWQVALVLHPERLKPARAAFFLRPRGGWAGEPAPRLVVALTPPVKAPPAPATPPAAPADLPGTVASPGAPLPDAEPPAASAESRFLLKRSPGPHRPAFWFLFALAWCIAVASLAFGLREYWLPPDVSPLPLRLAESSGQLFVEWDAADARVRAAESGTLEVDDGGWRTSYQLSAGQVQGGRLTYIRTSSDVAVRLRLALPGGRSIEGASRIAAPARPAAPAGAPPEEPPAPAVSPPGRRSPPSAKPRAAARKKPGRLSVSK
jgi:hypothetical protein